MSDGKRIIRITKFDGSDGYTIQRADNIEEHQAVNSADEGVSFEVSVLDAKIAQIDYTKWWEIWDSASNERINRGPIHEIVEGNEVWRVTGPGRSQILADVIMTKHTFYYPINRMIDDLRYENIAAEPRTTTRVNGQPGEPSADDSKYYGLSVKTKDNAIDDTITPDLTDKRLPTFHTTDSFWSGTGKADALKVNLGEKPAISRASIIFPWWGGFRRATNRTYDFSLEYAQDGENWTTAVTKDPNYNVTADRYGGFYFYFHSSGIVDNFGFEPLAERVADDPISSRYWRVNIHDTHAWYGNAVVGDPPIDRWDYQCISSTASGVMNSKTLEPGNDCHASVVEVGLYNEIIGRDEISNLAYQQVDNTSNQITYFHTFDSAENGQQLKKTSEGFWKYEPGNKFKRIRFTWSGTGASFTKFYNSDADHSFKACVLAVVDQNNSVVYRSESTADTKDLILPAYTQFIMIKGAANVTVVNTDTWIGEQNAFSVNNTLSSSIHAGDTATLHFRGATLKFFVTIPTGKQAGKVKYALRSKNMNTGLWGAFQVLADDVQLPNAVDNYKAYEIKVEDGLLSESGIYEFRVTNKGGYVGIDAFAGYWQASWIDFNEDHERILYADDVGSWKQIYDGRFSGGTMMKTNAFGAHAQFGFEGDRVQVFMAKGPNFGKATLYISGSGNYAQNIVPLGTSGNSVVIDLDTGAKGHYITQYLAFDSSDYFPNGMPWGIYNMHVRLLEVEEYNVEVNQIDSDNFDNTCENCNSQAAATGNNKTVKTNKYIYLDGISAHCTSGISAKFDNQTHLDILTSLAEAIQHEWIITEKGLKVRPRIGIDRDTIVHEGSQTVITSENVKDVSKVATLLYSSGADIDGLPLFTITEDKRNKEIMGRTISRTNDFRNVADYFTLIGASRTELYSRRTPEERISINHVGTLPVDIGDSFIFVSKRHRDGERVRLMKITRTQSASSGMSYSLECVKWPSTP